MKIFQRLTFHSPLGRHTDAVAPPKNGIVFKSVTLKEGKGWSPMLAVEEPIP